MDIRAVLQPQTKRETTVPEETKRVLLELVDSASRDRRGVSITYLASRLGIERQRLSEIIKILEQAEHVGVEKHGRVQLIAPTLLGYEKADVWQREKLPTPLLRQVPTLVKVVLGSLFAALLGLLWWWSGLAPQTTRLEPLGASVPVKVYDVGTWPLIEHGPFGGWFLLPASLDPGMTIPVNTDNELEKLFPENVPAALDGSVNYSLALQSYATRFEVVSGVSVEIESSPVDDLVNLLYFPPGPGGGYIVDAELKLYSGENRRVDSETRVLKTKLTLNGEPIDDITLTPGERQPVELNIDLGVPGRYTLTPIITCRYRDKVLAIRLQPYQVVFPRRYRVWIWSAIGWSPDSITIIPLWATPEPIPVSTDEVAAQGVIFDTQSTHVEIEPPVQPQPACLFPPRWIAFESTMGTVSDPRLFVVNTDGEELKMVSDQGLISEREASWVDGGNLQVVEPVYDTDADELSYAAFLFDPARNTRSAIPSHTLTATLPSLEDVLYDHRNCLAGGGCVTTCVLDTNGNGNIDASDSEQICIEIDGVTTRLGFSPGQYQSAPVLSPDHQWIAFVQGKDVEDRCGPNHSQDIYVMAVDGSKVRRLTKTSAWYQGLAWSPDGQHLAYESAPVDSTKAYACAGSTYHLYVIELKTASQRQLTSGTREDHAPQWSPDGEWVLGGGYRLTLSRWDGTCRQDIFTPPTGTIFGILLQP